MRTRLALAFAALVTSAGLAMTAAGPATFSGEAYPLDTCPVYREIALSQLSEEEMA